MLFKYKARDNTKGVIAGTVDAKGKVDALRLLRDRGFYVISLNEIKPIEAFTAVSSKISRVGFGDIVNLTRQLSTMVVAGLSLIESLNILKNQTRNTTFRKMLEKILKKVEGGGTLADALNQYPDHFSKIYVALVKAGESSGKIDVVLERLADNLESQREFRSKIKGAMIYPSIIVIGMVGVMFLMMTVVIPKLTSIYKEFDVTLPLPTQILIFLSNVFVNFWWLLLLLMAGGYALLMYWKKTEVGRQIWDQIILHIPIWGALRRETILVEMTRTLGLLAGAGVSILDALRIVAEAVDSDAYHKAVEKVSTRVEKGASLGVTVADNALFPPILGQMITVGEQTGKLDETLLRVSKFFQSAVDEKVKGLTTALEPIIMVVLGIGVAFLVLSIVLPMYQLTEAFQ